MNIRPIVPDDIPAVLDLMREFARYENLEDHLTATDERLNDAMFGESAFVHGLLAIEDLTVVGYALFYASFSSFRGDKGIYLEDLYIQQNYRRSGLGRDMLRHVARFASARGFRRIDFLVLNWNVTAVDFYKRLGADGNEDERHFRFVDEAFAALAA